MACSAVLLAVWLLPGLARANAASSRGVSANAPAGAQTGQAQPGQAQAESPVGGLTRPGVITIKGDLDCAKLVGELRAAVEDCCRADCGVVVLELSGTRWRPDVTLQMAEVLQQAREGASSSGETRPGVPSERGGDKASKARKAQPVRFVVFLNGANADDGRVGGGHAALALVADACVVSAQTRIEASASQHLKELCPAAGACAKAMDELREIIAARVVDRAKAHGRGPANSPVAASADAWAAALPAPSKAAWLSGRDPWSGQARALTTSKPRSGEVFTGELVCGPENAEPDALVLGLDTAQCLDTRMAFAKATSASTALVALGVRGSPVKRVTVSADLAGARERVNKALNELDPRLRAIEQNARDAGYSRSSETLTRRRRVGQDGLNQLTALEARLVEGEKLLGEYPELLLGLPPGQTPVGQKNTGSHEALWRTLLQDWRDRLAAARARCKALAEARAD